MGGGIAPGLPLRIPKMRHPRKLRKKKLHIIYLKGTHKKGGPKKKLQGCCFGTGGVAFLVQGVVVWVYCGKQFLVLRVCTVDGIFGTGVVVWVYCGKQFFGTEGVYCG